MPKQSGTLESPKASKRSPKPEVSPVDLAEDMAGFEQLPGGPLLAFGGGSSEDQTARLGDVQLQTAQRQALASKIGRSQGNLHLQRVLRQLAEDKPIRRVGIGSIAGASSMPTIPTTQQVSGSGGQASQTVGSTVPQIDVTRPTTVPTPGPAPNIGQLGGFGGIPIPMPTLGGIGGMGGMLGGGGDLGGLGGLGGMLGGLGGVAGMGDIKGEMPDLGGILGGGMGGLAGMLPQPSGMLGGLGAMGKDIFGPVMGGLGSLGGALGFGGGGSLGGMLGGLGSLVKGIPGALGGLGGMLPQTPGLPIPFPTVGGLGGALGGAGGGQGDALDLQQQMQKQQQVFQMMSNMMKMQHQTAMGAIRNIR